MGSEVERGFDARWQLVNEALKYFANPPKIITLEEPENGVHPQLLSQVIDRLKALADRKEPNKVQVFMTSHSPYVLNEFGERPESVHIFEKGLYDEVPRVIPLTERKQALTAADGLNRSLGDLGTPISLAGVRDENRSSHRGGIDEEILPSLIEQLMSVLPDHRRRGLDYYPVPFPPNG